MAMKEMPPQGPDVPPYVSLCLICGDEGIEGLPVLFESTLERPSGPMFDEVSVYWNGSAEKKSAVLKEPVYTTRLGFRVPFVVTDGPWRNDFAWARQISFEQANGVFRCYLDSDDAIPLPEASAVDEGLKILERTREEGEAIATTFRDFLKDLPPATNCVEGPYFYTEIEGLPAIVTPRRRCFRWADGWAWGNVVHEDCFPVRGNVANRIFHAGFVVQHHPLHSSESRVERNARILLDLEVRVGGPDKLDHRSLFGIACLHFDHQNDEKALEYFARALRATPPPPPQDIFIYRTMAAEAVVSGALSTRSTTPCTRCWPSRIGPWATWSWLGRTTCWDVSPIAYGGSGRGSRRRMAPPTVSSTPWPSTGSSGRWGPTPCSTWGLRTRRWSGPGWRPRRIPGLSPSTR